MRRLLLAAPLSALLGLGSPLTAQWLQYPTAGVPRTPDGKADLAAPTPRTGSGAPDLSGMWQVAQRLPCNDVTRLCTDLPIGAQFSNIGAGLPDGVPYSEWARERLKERQHKDDPYVRCLTPGGPRMHVLPMMQQIVQTPALILILNEYNATYRQVHMDGRPMPVDPNPTWQGYSTGRWEGDTLVVQSRGFRDDQWLDTVGSPLTNAATVTERFRRSNFGTLEVVVTVEDLKAYTRPWTIAIEKEVVVDSDMLDYMCLENEKDVQQLQSR